MVLSKPAYFTLFLTLPPLVYLCLYSCGNDSRQNLSKTEADNNRAEISYEELAKTNAAAWLNQQGDSVFEAGAYAAAMALYQQSMDSAAAQADSFLYYDSKLDLASVQDRLGEFQKAIAISETVVEAYIRSGDSIRIGRAYTALAGFYGKANLPGKSMEATRKGFDFLKQSGSLIHRCAAYNQMAFTYSDAGRWAEALPLLDTALQLMEASGVLNQRPGMRLNLGDCHRHLGNWAMARQYLEAAGAEADSLDQVHVKARTLERLSQLDEATGNPARALTLFREAKQIRDSIFSAEKTHSLQELEIQYETREKEQQIQILRANEQIHNARQALLLSVSLGLAAIIGFAGYIQRLRLNSARRLLAQKQQELSAYVQLLLEKNTQLLALEQSRGTHLPEILPDDAEKEEGLEGLYNSRILTDKDWESFKHRFESGHPGYLLRLRTAYPELSGAEERLLLLIKLGLNSQEVADTLGITVNGIKKGRQRLRKKLEIAPEEDLEQFVKGLLEQKK